MIVERGADIKERYRKRKIQRNRILRVPPGYGWRKTVTVSFRGRAS